MKRFGYSSFIAAPEFLGAADIPVATDDEKSVYPVGAIYRHHLIPGDAKGQIPKEAALVYWDYAHYKVDHYRDMIRRHKEIGFEPVMASGVWTWDRLWYFHRQTQQTVSPCLEACRKENIKEINPMDLTIDR